MSSRDPIRDACDYIDSHLTEEIGFTDVARAVAFSPFHFHRIFQGAVGESITDYIRRRRLAEAARQLTGTQRPIVEIALAYRFESQSSFTKAFRRLFGITPGAYRRKGVHTAMADDQLAKKAGGSKLRTSPEPRIIEFPERLVAGFPYVGTNLPGEVGNLYGALYQHAAEVPNRVDPDLTIGLCETVENPKGEGEHGYLCGIFIHEVGELPAGMVARRLPAGTYAVFTHFGGVATMDESYEYIWRTWLPASAYEALMTHEYELHDIHFDPESDESHLEIHVPVRLRPQ